MLNYCFQVIVVTANYRVGPLGFMTLEDDTLPGNLALWDQQLALRWVQQNILQFGGGQFEVECSRYTTSSGDPGKVTVFSNSAGSFCTYCLLVSPQCEVGGQQLGTLRYTIRACSIE